MEPLQPMAEAIAGLLRERGETVAICETTAGGLVSAALLSIPGASRYYAGAAVTYTGVARSTFLEIELGRLSGRPIQQRALRADHRAERSANASTRPGASERRARRDPAATSTGMPRATPASQSPGRPSTSRRLKPVSKTAKRTCGSSRSGRWRCSSRCCATRAKEPLPSYPRPLRHSCAGRNHDPLAVIRGTTCDVARTPYADTERRQRSELRQCSGASRFLPAQE